TLDMGFATSHQVGDKIEPANFFRQSDGSTQIAFNRLGYSTQYPAISHGFGRLNPDGSLDSGFDPIASFDPSGPLGPNFISLGFTSLSDGSLLLSGQGGNSVNYGHLLANGSEDTNYHPDPTVFSFAAAFPRSDGTLILSNDN